MKEIKAYVRVHRLDKVVSGPEDAGFTDMTVIDVRAIRRGIADEELEYSPDLAERCMNVAKLAIAVRDSDVDLVAAMPRRVARLRRVFLQLCEQPRVGIRPPTSVPLGSVSERCERAI
jgi:nitrogen regulatory protein PII